MLHLILFVLSLLGSLFYTSNFVNDFNNWLSKQGLDEKQVYASSLIIYSFGIYIFSLTTGAVINYLKRTDKDQKITELENTISNLNNTISNLNNKLIELKKENEFIREKFSTYSGNVGKMFDRIKQSEDPAKVTKHINICKTDLDNLINSSSVKLMTYDMSKLYPNSNQENNDEETNIID